MKRPRTIWLLWLFCTPLIQGCAWFPRPGASSDPIKYCEAKCPAMSDAERLDFYSKRIWGAKAVEVHSKRGSRPESMNAVLLILSSNGEGWDQLAAEAGMFAKTSPGSWRIGIYVTPKESVHRLMAKANESAKVTEGPGQAMVQGYLRVGTPLIEVLRR